MTAKADNVGGEGIDSEDLAWLDALRGKARPAGGSLPAGEQQATWRLGEAYRDHALRAAPQAPEPDSTQRQARLLAQARAAGLLSERAASPRRWPRWWPALGFPSGGWQWPTTGFALTLVGVMVATLWPGAPAPEEDTALRGPRVTQPISVADPLAAREAALAALRDAGVEAAPFEQTGALGLEVEVPAAPSPAARAALLRVFGSLPPSGPQQIVYRADTSLPSSPASATKPAQ